MNTQKYAVVTGATAGIGLETAKGLIKNGYIVIGTTRSKKKQEIAQEYLGKSAIFIETDLSSQKSIKAFADAIKQHIGENGLDVLINNAGTFYSYYALSEEGVQMQFAVNTIAPFYLSLLLYEKLKQTKGRIINVTSSSHYNTRLNFKDIQLARNYSQLRAYKQSKVYSILLSRWFNKLSSDVKTYMADPGLVNTEIGFKNTSGISKLFWKYRKNKGQSATVGAETSIHLAISKNISDNIYWKDSKVQKESKNATNDVFAQKIWEYCKKVCAIDADKILRG
ncbi:MAG: SDR family NAD(P)-dependent oxidoreductase [Clostridiales bacterium]|nr:SDR family NAD(P)-dependent oxidoreductase [Clostridiales bacterium]